MLLVLGVATFVDAAFVLGNLLAEGSQLVSYVQVDRVSGGKVFLRSLSDRSIYVTVKDLPDSVPRLVKLSAGQAIKMDGDLLFGTLLPSSM